MVKNCDLGLENAARGRRSQFFTIRTSQPANNIYIFFRTFEAMSQSWLNVVYEIISRIFTKYVFI